MNSIDDNTSTQSLEPGLYYCHPTFHPEARMIRRWDGTKFSLSVLESEIGTIFGDMVLAERCIHNNFIVGSKYET